VKESRIEDEEAAEDLAAEHHIDACRVGARKTPCPPLKDEERGRRTLGGRY
jgi:hypothetical protein